MQMEFGRSGFYKKQDMCLTSQTKYVVHSYEKKVTLTLLCGSQLAFLWGI